MSDPATTQAASEPAQAPVTVLSTAPVTDSGRLVLALIDAPAAGLRRAVLTLDPRDQTVALMAPCGCQVSLSLGALINRLAAAMASDHAAHPAGTHVGLH